MRARLLALIALGAAACDSGDVASPGSTTQLDLQVEPVKVAADPGALGHVRGVAELSGSFVVFGDKGAVAVQASLPSASDDTIKTWADGAATVLAADGSGRWPISVDDQGRVLRLREDGRLEEIGPRYGVSVGERVRAVVPADDSTFVIVLEAQVIAVDVAHATTRRYDTGPLDHVSATSGYVAGTTATEVRVLDLAAGKSTNYDVIGPIATTFDESHHVVVMTDHALLRQVDGRSSLEVIAERPKLHGLTRTPDRVWFGAGTDLWALDQTGVKIARGVALPGDATLSGSASGDVWVLAAELARVKTVTTTQAGGGENATEAAWTTEILPIYQGVCSSCHGPGGSAGIDLSTYEGWVARRAVIRARVVDQKNMPPKPKELTAEQLDAITRFTK